MLIRYSDRHAEKKRNSPDVGKFYEALRRPRGGDNHNYNITDNVDNINIVSYKRPAGTSKAYALQKLNDEGEIELLEQARKEAAMPRKADGHAPPELTFSAFLATPYARCRPEEFEAIMQDQLQHQVPEAKRESVRHEATHGTDWTYGPDRWYACCVLMRHGATFLTD